MFVDIPQRFMGSKFNPFVISARQELLSFYVLLLENNILTNIFFCAQLCLVNHLMRSAELIECKWDNSSPAGHSTLLF